MHDDLLDLRGRPNPEPVIEVRRRIGAGDTSHLVVLVDDPRAAEGLAELAGGMGWSSRVERTIEGDLRVSLRTRRSLPSTGLGLAPRPLDPEETHDAPVEPAPRPTRPPRRVVLVASLRVGEGEAGEQLLWELLRALPHAPTPPDAVVLLNDAAQLLDERRGVSDALEALAQGGAVVLVGAACAERFGLANRLRFARPVSTSELASLLLSAERVVRF